MPNKDNCPSGAGAPFTVRLPIRFGDCDPAGIVFYPRYFEMFNRVVEDWCATGLGVDFRELHMVRRLGMPAVHIETDFSAPAELGDILLAQLSVEKLGRASIGLRIVLRGPAGEERVCARLVLAMMDLEKRRAIPVPEGLRGRMAAFLVNGPGQGPEHAAEAPDEKARKG